ncbi:hypothetical protein BSK67_18445 [Paenibacillus odorifer]|nr:hypothetical protein BSK67_18445 [Paenibacillus odorifer]
MKLNDLAGRKINNWTVVERVEGRNSGGAWWFCKCECGTTREVLGTNIIRGRSKSCGCINKTHLMNRSRLFYTYYAMKKRCKDTSSSRYGGRGITYCEEWESFIPFMNWALANGYNDELQIDRIDYDGNYEPSNCRWVTSKENNNNRCNNVPIEINGVKKNLSTWAEEYGLSVQTVWRRYNKLGKTGMDLIKPVKKTGGSQNCAIKAKVS